MNIISIFQLRLAEEDPVYSHFSLWSPSHNPVNPNYKQWWSNVFTDVKILHSCSATLCTTQFSALSIIHNTFLCDLLWRNCKIICFRYLYVNSRPWPCGYRIKSPLDPPPIAQEIDIHVIDLVTLQEVGTMLRAHKAYTPNNECFFIFLDVCNEYVAR